MIENDTLLEEYKAIGTVEEFKALKERDTAKEPIIAKATDKLMNGYLECPICHNVVGVEDIENKYCSECGQHINHNNSI